MKAMMIAAKVDVPAKNHINSYMNNNNTPLIIFLSFLGYFYKINDKIMLFLSI